ncbi:hypothetical protein Gogos_004779, partial [Gossypium gossypioides]|nr:hypothetical protein [Gossypium gossypioides]
VLDCLILLQRPWGGYNKVFVHADSLKVVNAFQNRHLAKSTSALVRRIYLILQTMDQWSIRHVPREKNQVVGRIVKMASVRIEDVHVFGNILE